MLLTTRGHPASKKDWTCFKVNVSVWQPAGTAFIQEVDVLDEKTEEGNYDLQTERKAGHTGGRG